MTKITLEGLSSLGPPENRSLADIKVYYNDTVYDWKIYIPHDIEDLTEYLSKVIESVEVEIEQKENEWTNLNPKIRYVEQFNTETNQIEQVEQPILKEEIVKPNLEDYISLRRKEYPDITEQLDAIWKGIDSEEFNTMLRKIEDVKKKYPKNYLHRDTEKILSQKKMDLIKYLSTVRSRYEINGVVVNGIKINTDINSQTKLIGAMMITSKDPTNAVTWKTATGEFVELNAEQILHIVLSVKDHIQNCFYWELNLKNQILESTTIEELSVIENDIETLNNSLT